MINLLPEERKQNIRAGRMNVILLRYNVFTLMFICLGAVICLGFYLVMQAESSNATATSNANNSQAASLSEVKTAAESYRNNLTIAKQILDNGISYTDVIVAITKLIPSGVVLDGINLTATDFGKQTNFSAHATSYAAAIQLKENFQKSKVFTNVYFTNLTDSNATGTSNGVSKYPVTITISALLNKAGTF